MGYILYLNLDQTEDEKLEIILCHYFDLEIKNNFSRMSSRSISVP